MIVKGSSGSWCRSGLVPLFGALVLLGSMACATPGGSVAPPPGGSVATIDVGGQTVTVAGPEGSTVTVVSADLGSLPSPPPDLELPVGALSIDVAGVTPGSVATVTVTLEQPVDSVLKLLGGVWDPFAPDGTTGATVSPSGLTITLQLQDGGRGDTDGAPDGKISDPMLPTNAPEPPWMSGCYQGPAGGIEFFGPVNSYHNAQRYGSLDGSCTGPELEALTIVRADTSTAAYFACNGINPGYSGIGNLLTSFNPPYATAPPDAWYCAPANV